MSNRGRLTVLVANIGGQGRVPELAEQIRRRKPKAVVVTEAYRARKFLRSIPGYRLRQANRRHGAEAPGVAVLVRRRIPIKWERLVKMRRRWWGPFTGRGRAPRVYRKMTLRTGRTPWPLLALHLPPGGPRGGVRIGGRNAGSWMESATYVTRWLKKRKRAVALGDLNGDAGEIREHITRPAGARMGSVGKVTHAVATGARVRSQRINPPPGCHGWGVFTFTKE